MMDDDDDGYSFTVKGHGHQEKVPVVIGSVDVQILVDSGSDSNVIDKALWEEM